MTQKKSAVQEKSLLLSDSMFQLQKDFKSGKINRADADTEANIVGKNLKALSLIWADQMREIALENMQSKTRLLETK